MLFSGKRTKKGKFYIEIFSTLLLCSVIPIIILAVSTYTYSSNILEQEVDRSNHIVQKQLQEKLDMSLENIRRDVLNYLFYDSTINAFAYKSNDKDFYLTSELLSDINQLKSNHSYIEDVVLYIHDIEFIMNCEGSMNAMFYFDKFQSLEFTKIVDTVGFWQEDYVDQYKTAYKEYDAIIFSSTLPMNSDKINVSLAIVIDKAKVRNDIEAWNLSQRGQTFILDEQNNIIVDYVPSGEFPINVSDIIDIGEEESTKVDIGGSRWIKISESSSVTNWKYVTLIPYGEITSKTKAILWRTSLWGTVIMFLSILASLVLTKKLYHPIGNLIKKVVDDTEDVERGEHRDEFSILHTNIDQMIFQNKDLQMQILKTVPILQQTFLKNLLNGEIDPEDINDKMAEYNMNMPNKYFTVILFEGQDIGAEGLSPLFKSLFVNYYIVEEHSCFVAIINFNKCDFEKIKEYFKEYDMVIAQGATYESINEIVKSYNQAKYAYQYRTNGKALEYLSIAEIINKDYSKFKLSKQYEVQYKNWMDLEKNDNAYEIIWKLVTELISENTPRFFRKRAIEELYTFAESISDSYRIPWNEMIRDLTDYEIWKNQDREIEESREYILRIYNNIRTYRISNGFSKDDDLMDRVLEIIHCRYSEDISLEEIAEEMQMSYSYLSKVFKKETGEGFVEYLTRKRIEVSIELLMREELSIDAVSVMVGYLNTPTYIRNFKKIMGVPPGKYRTLL